MKLSVLFFFLFSFVAYPAEGQTNKNPNWELGATIGPYLPLNQPGVHEILPFSGLRISKGIYSFRPELTALHGRSQGVIYYLGQISVRNSIQLEGLEPFWLIGMDYKYCRPFYQGSPVQPFHGQSGWHYGFGSFMDITGNLKFRSDFTLTIRPGQSLYVGVGLEYFFDSLKEEKTP